MWRMKRPWPLIVVTALTMTALLAVAQPVEAQPVATASEHTGDRRPVPHHRVLAGRGAGGADPQRPPGP